ncbi:MAG: DUF2895 family protein [Pseudomonadales bacterium]
MLTARLHHLKIVIAVLLGVIALQFVYMMMATIGWMRAGEDISINIRPPLPNASQVYKRGDIPAPTAWGFAITTWQMTRRCSTNCAINEPDNIKTAKYFALVSGAMYADLMNNFNQRKAQSRVNGRTRELTLAQKVYSSDYTRPYKTGWEVIVDLRVKETVNNSKIKDTVIRYYLYVVNDSSDSNRNPWGLTLDGYTRPPVRVDAEYQS